MFLKFYCNLYQQLKLGPFLIWLPTLEIAIQTQVSLDLYEFYYALDMANKVDNGIILTLSGCVN